MMRRLLLLILLTASAAGGCGDDEGGYVIDPIEQVTYTTAAGTDAFVRVAAEKGFFGDAGIQVDIRKGAGGLPAVEPGRAQFATVDFGVAEVLAGKGDFSAWRAIAAIDPKTLACIMTTATTGITAPADLAGRTIATAEGSASETLLPAYARAAGFDAATVKTRPTELNGLMARREADAISTSVLGEEALRTASKQRVVVMPFSDHLGNLYGNVIITRADLITEDPGLVSRFTTAALRGQKYTLDHPGEAAALLETTDPAAAGEIKTMMRYVSPPTAEPIGFLDQRRVAASIADLEAAGLIPAGLTPTALADFSFVTGP